MLFLHDAGRHVNSKEPDADSITAVLALLVIQSPTVQNQPCIHFIVMGVSAHHIIQRR
jgi:hypothetical protein